MQNIPTASNKPSSCAAMFIAAPSSGQGKTTVTSALARYFVNQGKRVRVFKTGPDYLDPQVLAQASGAPVEQLDIWMAGEEYCKRKLYEASLESDLILIEGVMGLYDGEPSSADLAILFSLPVILVMDVKGMAQTAAAIIHGLANYRPELNVVGLIANKCGSARHAELIQNAMPTDIKLLATIKRDEDIALPERHLGLVQANEVSNELESRFNAGAQALKDGGLVTLESSGLFNTLLQVKFEQPDQETQYEKLLSGKTIAIARDQAFSFIYQANLKLLEKLGADCVFFSPLSDKQLPPSDAIWLPGGYPELHAKTLEKNHSIQDALQAFFNSGKPILAECGGLLYCLCTLTDLNGDTSNMLGLISGHGAMRGKRGCQGMQSACLPEGEVKAHAHHRSRCEIGIEPVGYGKRQRHPAPGEPIFRVNGLTATYLHLYFPSNPNAIANLFLASAKSSDLREKKHAI